MRLALWVLLGALTTLSLGLPPARARRLSVDGICTGFGAERAGREEGLWSLLAPDGRRMAQGEYVDGVPDGIWKLLWPDGSLHERFELKRGVRHGAAATWHANGAVASRGNYRDGQPDGAWLFWDPAGVLDPAASGYFELGQRRG